MSFPKAWNSSVHDALGVDPVLETPAPEPSAAYKSVVRNGAVQDGKGNWVQAWVEREMFTEYTDENGDVQTVAAQKTAYDTANTATLAAGARSKRDHLLKETDHYGLSDVTMSTEMTTYRQALRDVPQQTDFPGTISWPEKP
jgi:hypothetical protein